MLWQRRTFVFLLLAALFLSIGALLYPSTFLRSLSHGTVLNDAQSLQSDPLGIVVIDISSEETANSFHVTQMGVYVLAVREDSPADLAGIRSGDQILSFESRPVTSSLDINQIQAKGENPANLVILREGKERTVQVHLSPTEAD